MRKKLKPSKFVLVKAKRLPGGNYSISLNINLDNKEEYFFKIDLHNGNNNIDNKENESDNRDISLIDYLEYIANKYKQKTSRRAGFYALLQHIKRYKQDETPIKEIDKEYLLGFLEYLRTARQIHPKDEKMIGLNTQAYYFRRLNYVLNYALSEEIITENPIAKILKEERPKSQRSERNYLTIDEIRLLAMTDFYNTVLKRAFLFSCFCGLRYSDIAALTWGNLHRTKTGKVELRIMQQKTKEKISLPLSHEAIKQLPERKRLSNSDRVFQGLVSLSRSNEILTRWAYSAGINKHITFHVARHTHATMMITLGVDLYTVSKLLGHTNIQTTQIYTQLVDESKEKAINLIPDIT